MATSPSEEEGQIGRPRHRLFSSTFELPSSTSSLTTSTTTTQTTSQSSSSILPTPDSRDADRNREANITYDPYDTNAALSGDEAGSSRLPMDESLTVRRREANRLAAQRFRSRKKGYQDSLEEKVKALEEEREVLVRRLESGDDPMVKATGEDSSRNRKPQRSLSPLLESQTHSYHRGRTRRKSASPSPRDQPTDAELRVASLEAANRRLQNELRLALEDNEGLRMELDRWLEWDRSMRLNSSRDSTQYYSDSNFAERKPILPPVDPRHNLSTYPQRPPHRSTTSLDRITEFSPQFRSRGGGAVQLPPLRLPPLPPPMSPGRLPLPPSHLPPLQSPTNLGRLPLPSPHLPPSSQLPRPHPSYPHSRPYPSDSTSPRTSPREREPRSIYDPQGSSYPSDTHR